MLTRALAVIAVMPIGVVLAELTLPFRPPNLINIVSWLGIGIIFALVAIANALADKE